MSFPSLLGGNYFLLCVVLKPLFLSLCFDEDFLDYQELNKQTDKQTHLPVFAGRLCALLPPLTRLVLSLGISGWKFSLKSFQVFPSVHFCCSLSQLPSIHRGFDCPNLPRNLSLASQTSGSLLSVSLVIFCLSGCGCLDRLTACLRSAYCFSILNGSWVRWDRKECLMAVL